MPVVDTMQSRGRVWAAIGNPASRRGATSWALLMENRPDYVQKKNKKKANPGLVLEKPAAVLALINQNNSCAAFPRRPTFPFGHRGGAGTPSSATNWAETFFWKRPPRSIQAGGPGARGRRGHGPGIFRRGGAGGAIGPCGWAGHGAKRRSRRGQSLFYIYPPCTTALPQGPSLHPICACCS